MMTNPVITNNFYRVLFTVAFAFIYCSQRCNAQPVMNMRNLQEILDAAQSGAANDNALIATIVQRLDALVGKSDNSAVIEKAQLVRIAAFVPVNLDEAGKQAAIGQRAAVLQRYLTTDFNITTDGSALLYLASGMVGLPIDQKSAMAFAKDASIPNSLRLVAIEAVFHQPQISADIQSDLAELSKDDWHFVDPVDVGPRTGIRVYPIREMALKVLQKRDRSGTTTAGQAEAQQPQNHNIVVPSPMESAQAPLISKSGTEHIRSALPTPTMEPSSSIPWSIIVVMIATAVGLFWLVFKRRS